MALVGMKNLISRTQRRDLGVRVAACGAMVALAAGCGGGGGGKSSPKPDVTTTAPRPTQSLATGDSTGTPLIPGGVTPVYPAGQVLPAYNGGDISKYTDSMKAAADKGMQVWIETDLVQPWLKGPDAFDAAVEQLAFEAKTVPQVVGFKIADELGQSQKSTATPADALKFLHDARAALHANAPGKLVAIDLIGYDLGCVPNSTGKAHDACIEKNAGLDARLSLDTIDKIVASGYIDMLDVTTYMLDPATYQADFNVTRTQAQQAAFEEVKHRGWEKEITVNTRKALSWPTKAPIMDPDGAAAMVPDFIDTPIQAGAAGVDVWSWSQKWGQSGAVVHLMSPNYTSNALWDALVQRHDKGDKLYVHYTPSYSEGTLAQDMDHMSKAFTAVFVAAGHSTSTTG